MTINYPQQTASGRLVLDLETAAIDGAEAYLETSPAPSNYKDPVKIQAYQEEKAKDALEKAALDPDLCRIVASGAWVEGEGAGRIETATTEQEEAELIAALWRVIGERVIVGYNVLQFDAPVLLRRSLYLGVPVPTQLDLSKYKCTRVQDLMQILSVQGMFRYRGLAFYMKRFGLTGPTSKISGSDVPTCARDGLWHFITEHVEDDLRMTVDLAERVVGFRRAR
jgi:DNA polymerase elongation subunit (family B)